MPMPGTRPLIICPCCGNPLDTSGGAAGFKWLCNRHGLLSLPGVGGSRPVCYACQSEHKTLHSIYADTAACNALQYGGDKGCGCVFPADILNPEIRKIRISFAGPAGSGKTALIHSIIKELKGKGSAAYFYREMFISDDVKEQPHNGMAYLNPYYASFIDGRGQKNILVMYDFLGRDFDEKGEGNSQLLKTAASSDCVFIVSDAAMFIGKNSEQHNKMAELRFAFENLLRFMYRHSENTQKMPMLANIFSKTDTAEVQQEISRLYSLPDMADYDKLLKHLVISASPELHIMFDTDYIKQKRSFAVSSIGEEEHIAKSGKNQNIEHLFKVLDPIYWVIDGQLALGKQENTNSGRGM